MIDETFRLIVLSFKNADIDVARNSLDKYYVSLAEIKDFNVLINSNFFVQLIKNKQEAYEKLHQETMKISRNNGYTTGNLLYYSYHQNCYKLIGMDLSRQTNRLSSN